LRPAAALLLPLLLLLPACGGDDDAGAGAEPLTVYAASSLTEVFQELDPSNRYNFAGSDELATQIREGGEADVYAAASPRYPDELADEGLVDEPRIFATNRLVLIVPSGRRRSIKSIEDLPQDGVKLVIGAEGVPVGDYTRDVLERLGRTDVLEQVVSEEENVKGVVAKVALGEADAGFVYATDAIAAGDKVTTVELPAHAQADVRYPVAVVAETDQRDEAEEFVDLLLDPGGQAALEDAGFGRP
jgi:molybdate transport system substrate-binding protein